MDHEHEPVELGLGQGIGAFLFNRVLCGQDKEGVGQGIVCAADADLALLHRFEHGGLGLGRGAVDFVGQDHVGEDGAFEELELAVAGGFVLVDDLGAGDVAGHQVGRGTGSA